MHYSTIVMLSREDIKQLNGFFDVKKLVQIIIPILEPYSEDFAVEPHETTCGCCLGDTSCPCTYDELSKRHPKSRIIFAEKTHGEWIKFPYETENEPE